MLRKLEPSTDTRLSRKAIRLGYVLRYYKPSQLAWRLVSLGRKKAFRLGGGWRYARVPQLAVETRGAVGIAQMAKRKLAAREEWWGSLRSAYPTCLTHPTRFRFLGVERELPDPIDWRLGDWPEAPHLWRFHLHYHEFLLDLAAAGCETRRPEYVRRAWDVVGQWLEANPLDARAALDDAWHPFCISRRLPAWIALWSTAPPEEQREAVLAGIFRQARYLEDHLERDLGGNHLLENARGLVLAGCFLEGRDAERWRRKGAAILRKELPRQILPHGEHFERSPGYHAEMLELVLDVRDAAAETMPDLSVLCATMAERMARFLNEIRHPDGNLPLWGDSWLGGAHGNSESQYVARPSWPCCFTGWKPVPQNSERAAVVVGDYWVYRDGGDCVLFDAGPVGPDHLPAHAHADLLSLEASLGGRRLFVDSGVSSYEDDPARRYCRSTAAHNVLQIDGAEQCDLWSRFRMGYRGHAFGFRSGREAGFHWARACHDAYRRVGVPEVGRWMGCRPGGPWVCLDWAEGQGRHELTLRLHLHPDVAVEASADDEVRLRVGGRECRLRFLTPGAVTIADGWYCERIGHRRPTQVVHFSNTATLPAVCGWSLAGDDTQPAIWLEGTHPAGIILHWGKDDILLKGL